MSAQPLGFWIVIAGIVIVVLGVLVWTGNLSWFGRLPGDIRSERGSVRFYFPIVSMLLLSIVVSLLFQVIRRIFR